MAERNIDKIKRLEQKIREQSNELGRYADKVAHDKKYIKQLEQERDDTLMAAHAVSLQADAIYIALAMEYGKHHESEQAWSLEMPTCDLNLLEQYEVKCRKTETGYTIGVFDKDWKHEPGVENLPETCKDPVSIDAEDANHAE